MAAAKEESKIMHYIQLMKLFLTNGSDLNYGGNKKSAAALIMTRLHFFEDNEYVKTLLTQLASGDI